MKNVKWRSAAAVMITVSMLCGCSGQRAGSQGPGEIVMSQDTAETETITVGTAGSISEGSTSGDSSFSIGARPMLISMIPDDADDVEASVEWYEVLPDLGNVENGEQFNDDRDKTNLLVQSGFVVHGTAGDEFYEIYKSNQYSMTPNFITVDSLMHTYHLFFKHLFKYVEQYSLSNYVLQLSQRMRDNSTVQYELLKGSEWESAAQRNVAFFTVGAKLLDEGTPVNKDVEDIVQYEFEQIARAEENVMSELTGESEDYSRYKPRGYYEKDEGLGAYFRAMMWYGGIQFKQDNEDLDRSALLIAKALDGDGEAYRLWEAVYAATSFFAGACDDLGVCEYMPVIRQAYGEAMEVEDLIGNTEAFSKFRSLAAKLPVPVTNSLSILDEEDNVIRGFRFMGQQFTIDTAMMQKLIYSNVLEDSQGVKRTLPDVLDVPAVLGSDMALRILEENGALDYKGYPENMEKLRNSLSEADNSLWGANLYASWLNTLMPLLKEKGEGYPVFMQNTEWTKKNLECFAGSFTEFKHDPVFYSKYERIGISDEMGEEQDDRGYVEPEPLVYKRLRDLADRTAQGLKKYEILYFFDEQNLTCLSELADRLFVISLKELREENLTDEEYDLIRGYGDSIEEIWFQSVTYGDEDIGIYALDCPAAVVADIMADQDGTALETATGKPSKIYVIVKVDGKLKVATGSVYTFYQFTVPLVNRLSDTEWCIMMGIKSDENIRINNWMKIDQPDWTESYRYRKYWESFLPAGYAG